MRTKSPEKPTKTPQRVHKQNPRKARFQTLSQPWPKLRTPTKPWLQGVVGALLPRFELHISAQPRAFKRLEPWAQFLIAKLSSLDSLECLVSCFHLWMLKNCQMPYTNDTWHLRWANRILRKASSIPSDLHSNINICPWGTGELLAQTPMNGRRQPICEGIVLVLPSGITWTNTLNPLQISATQARGVWLRWKMYWIRESMSVYVWKGE